MGEIYKITNLVNGKCYVGKTKHESVIRWRDHINGYHSSSLIHKAIVKYGVDNFSFEVIESNVQESLLNELEMFYISKFNSKTPNGYNLTDGGDSGLGLVVSEETRSYQIPINPFLTCTINVKWAIGDNSSWISVDLSEDGSIAFIKLNVNHPFFKPFSEIAFKLSSFSSVLAANTTLPSLLR